VLLFGQEVRAGNRDEIVVFWTNGNEERVIVDSGYEDAHTALKRILRRFDGAMPQYDNLGIACFANFCAASYELQSTGSVG
jgi:hypothetical protein